MTKPDILEMQGALILDARPGTRKTTSDRLKELVEAARAEGAADEAKAIAGYLRALSDGGGSASSKRALRVAANDIERGEHRKVAL